MRQHVSPALTLIAAMPWLAGQALAHPGHDHSHTSHAVWEAPQTLPTAPLSILLLSGALAAVALGAWLVRSRARKRDK